MTKRIPCVKPADLPQHLRLDLEPMARRRDHYDPYVLIGLGVVLIALLGLIVYLNIGG